ncbi:MAG TPA: bis(5'-nucleosyl)-tetraphosphatase (symmetrical) YqeK [Tissierellaceae bacterium]|nr:bis(5'-nucleosyl)-tetraphosphatase (symmetrical) YqeK [Tissierellaceae bacterium]
MSIIDEAILEQLLVDLGEDRFNHSLRVVEEAERLASKYNIDREKAVTAALLHDCAKFSDKKKILKMANYFDIIISDIMIHNKQLIHGPLGAKMAQDKYKVYDVDILNAIEFHTTGRKDMSKLEKLIYIADYIEPGRKFPGVNQVRRLAYVDLDRSILLAMDETIVFLVKNNRLISPYTIEARNQLEINLNYKEVWNERS